VLLSLGRKEVMQRRWLGILAVLLIVLSLLLILVSHTSVFAHTAIVVDTPTPDVNAILTKANDASTQAQNLNTIMTIGLAIVGIVLTALAIVSGGLAFFGITSLRDINNLRDQMSKDLEKVHRDATAIQGSLVYLGLGDRLMNKGLTKEAIENYRKARTFSPENDQINYILGRIYSSAGYFDDAITVFTAATTVNAENAEAWRDLGLAYRRRGEKMSDLENFEKALYCLKKAVALHPQDDDTYAVIGGLYRRKKEYRSALANYTQAYAINPGSSYALGNMASLAWYLDEMQEARKYFTDTELASSWRIAAGTPEGYWDYYDRALSQLALGNPHALTSYKEAIQHTPTPSKVTFDAVLDNLHLLNRAPTAIPHLPQVIQMIEDAKRKSL